ncbi:hypothetical protein EDC01DRAFT_633845 [Geopyxis carbonaria]|nr:hypothetical protein EDC01DRAFT_633845 [Geopyxis carbonaria]
MPAPRTMPAPHSKPRQRERQSLCQHLLRHLRALFSTHTTPHPRRPRRASAPVPTTKHSHSQSHSRSRFRQRPSSPAASEVSFACVGLPPAPPPPPPMPPMPQTQKQKPQRQKNGKAKMPLGQFTMSSRNQNNPGRTRPGPAARTCTRCGHSTTHSTCLCASCRAADPNAEYSSGSRGSNIELCYGCQRRPVEGERGVGLCGVCSPLGRAESVRQRKEAQRREEAMRFTVSDYLDPEQLEEEDEEGEIWIAHEDAAYGGYGYEGYGEGSVYGGYGEGGEEGQGQVARITDVVRELDWEYHCQLRR